MKLYMRVEELAGSQETGFKPRRCTLPVRLPLDAASIMAFAWELAPGMLA